MAAIGTGMASFIAVVMWMASAGAASLIRKMEVEVKAMPHDVRSNRQRQHSHRRHRRSRPTGAAHLDPDIALGKPVTCSGTSPANSVEHPCTAAVDGNAGTRWSGGPGAPNTWIEIDFQGNYDVASVGITFQYAYSKQFNICCGPTANPQGNCEEHQGREGAQEVSYLATGRYLRITNLEGREGNSGWGMSMYQLSVLGTPAVWAKTDGNCRGGESWPDGDLWDCIWATRGEMALQECKEACANEPHCAAFDTSLTPTSPSTEKGTCCLFKEGNTGNGGNDKWCYLKAVATPLWSQHGPDNQKCIAFNGQRGLSQQQCQQRAETAGYSYYQYAATADGQSLCQEVDSCDSPITGTSWDWKVFKKDTACLGAGWKYVPNMAGQSKTTGETAQTCQARCGQVEGCAHFSTFTNGDCYVQDAQASRAYAAYGVEAGTSTCILTASSVVRDSPYDGKKCDNWGSGSESRVFDLRGGDATEEKCSAKCQEKSTCVAYSGIFNSWCIGCDKTLQTDESGSKAYKKATASGSGSVCEDDADYRLRNENCADWANYNCNQYNGYSSAELADLRDNCPLSCKVCSELTTTTTTAEAFSDLGSGHCATGYYAGWVAADAVDLETCKAKCLTEPECRFISLKLGASCSRYNSDAGSCDRNGGHSDHHTYERISATGSYTAMSKGVAACPAGTEIQSQAECKEALGALGLCHDSAWTGSITLIPAYCSHRPDHCGLHDWHFNSQTTGNSGRSDTAPICKAVTTTTTTVDLTTTTTTADLTTTTTTAAAGPTVPGQLPDPVITITQTDANQLEATVSAAKEQITRFGKLVKQLLAPGSFKSVNELLPVDEPKAQATPDDWLNESASEPARLEAPPPGASVDATQPVRL